MNSVEIITYQCRIMKTLELIKEREPDARLSDIVDAMPEIMMYMLDKGHVDKRIEESAVLCINRLVEKHLLPAWVA